MIQSQLHPLRLRATLHESSFGRSTWLAGQHSDPGGRSGCGPGPVRLTIARSVAKLRNVMRTSSSVIGRRARCFDAIQGICTLLDLSREGIGDKRKQLIGAYFCQEYSYAAAALMTPASCAPDQSGLDQRTIRISCRCARVGEGHISSIASVRVWFE